MTLFRENTNNFSMLRIYTMQNMTKRIGMHLGIWGRPEEKHAEASVAHKKTTRRENILVVVLVQNILHISQAEIFQKMHNICTQWIRKFKIDQLRKYHSYKAFSLAIKEMSILFKKNSSNGLKFIR